MTIQVFDCFRADAESEMHVQQDEFYHSCTVGKANSKHHPQNTRIL